MRPIRTGLTVAAVLLGILFLSSCYTVLKHPREVSMSDESGGRRSCADCHDQAFYYHDPFMYRYYDRYPYSDRWYGYYYDPWWYDDYWYYDSGGEGLPIERGERVRWGSSDLPPPPDRGATTAVESGSSAPKGTGSSGQPSEGEGAQGSSVKKKERTRYGGSNLPPPPPKKAPPAKKSDRKPEKTEDEDDDGGPRR